MDEMNGNGRTHGRDSLDLDALAVSDRFRLFNFTRRDDHLAYLWVLRALDRLRVVHQVQAHSEDVAQALAELAAAHEDVPAFHDQMRLRERLDALADDQILHRLEDASRAGSLARYRNRQSVYQFSELGYRAYAAVEDVLAARIRDANLSRLVFSDILDDLRALHAAVSARDGDQVYRRLSRLDTVLDDMSRRAAQFHLTLAELMRSTDTSPETFLKYKNAVLTHMTDFMTELDRYLPRLAAAIDAVSVPAVSAPAVGATGVGGTGVSVMLGLAAAADDRPFLSDEDKHDDWRRRWAALGAWFAADVGAAGTAAQARAEGLRTATRAAVSAVIALLRQVTEATPGVPQPARNNPAVKAELARRQAEQRAAERAAARSLLEAGARDRVLDEAETRVLLRLLTLATEARTVVAGRLATATGGNDVLTMRLLPSDTGSSVRTAQGTLHLPGFELRLEPAGSR
jgi:hypothetical protein